MEITEVRIKLMEGSADRLQGFCSITFDNSFVVRDLKIIEGTNGPFVAMPSRKLTAHCPSCGSKNHLRAGYCNQCGIRLKEERGPRDAEGRMKLYADIAHPINSACREAIQGRVIAEFRAELERAMQPGYVSRYEDDYFDDEMVEPEWQPGETRSEGAPAVGSDPVGTIPRAPGGIQREDVGERGAPSQSPNKAPAQERPRPMPPPPHAFPGPPNPASAAGEQADSARSSSKERPAKPKTSFGQGIFEG